MIPDQFQAFVVTGDGSAGVRVITPDQLGDGDVVIKVKMSSVNYKDGLAATAGGGLARIDPLIPGIDLAGTVVDPGVSNLFFGQKVLAHGYDLGVGHNGGYSEYARVDRGWVVELPEDLTIAEAMSIGTAGFAAALSLVRLEHHGLQPSDGPVLVTGASGGVGSVAVGILAHRGYEVVASTGKDSARDWLQALGAARVVARPETAAPAEALQRECWAGAIDCVGGDTLAHVLSSLQHGGAVAAIGNAGGAALATTALPFVMRGASLLGIDSVHCPLPLRKRVWNRLGADLRPRALGSIGTQTVDLDGLPGALLKVLTGESTGRTLVRVS